MDSVNALDYGRQRWTVRWTRRGRLMLDILLMPLVYITYIFLERLDMPQANVQVPVLMSPAQKRRLARKAKAANLTMGELLRQGGERFSPAEDDAALDQFAKQVTKATQRAIQSIDRTMVLVAQSEARIQALTKSHRGY